MDETDARTDIGKGISGISTPSRAEVAFRRRCDILKRWPGSGLTQRDIVNNASNLCATYSSANRWADVRDTSAEVLPWARLNITQAPNKMTEHLNFLSVLQYSAEASEQFNQPKAMFAAFEEQAASLTLLMSVKHQPFKHIDLADILLRRSLLLSKHGQPDRAQGDRELGLRIVQEILEGLPKDTPERAEVEGLKSQLETPLPK